MTTTRARVCEGKRRQTKAEAEATLRHLIAQGAAPGLMSAYRCSRCGHYHVGHTRGRRRRRR
jgi:hypothetical protein